METDAELMQKDSFKISQPPTCSRTKCFITNDSIFFVCILFSQHTPFSKWPVVWCKARIFIKTFASWIMLQDIIFWYMQCFWVSLPWCMPIRFSFIHQLDAGAVSKGQLGGAQSAFHANPTGYCVLLYFIIQLQTEGEPRGFSFSYSPQKLETHTFTIRSQWWRPVLLSIVLLLPTPLNGFFIASHLSFL